MHSKDDLGEACDQDGGVVTEIKDASYSAAGLGFREVGAVPRNIHHHVNGFEAQGSFWISFTIIQKEKNIIPSFICGISLLGCKGSERHQQGEVQRQTIVEEDANDLLDEFFD